MSFEKTSFQLDGLVSGDDLEKAAKKRADKYQYIKVHPSEIQDKLNEGWQRSKKLKKHFKLKKLRDKGSLFEDRVWSLFYKMGFTEMNEDRNFIIPYNETSSVGKQTDVFARQDQCICVVECKTTESEKSKSFGKDINELQNLIQSRKEIISKHYKNKDDFSKFKFVWIFALENINLNKNDIERAQSQGDASKTIFILDENLLSYYEKLADHFGKSAKYQFLGDLIGDREFDKLLDPIPAIKGKMGKIPFYSFLIEPEILLKIAYVAHRGKSNANDIDTYQRMVDKSRLSKIATYIENESGCSGGGIFPTSIVINFEYDSDLKFERASGMADKNAEVGTLHLPNRYHSAWIIDGQHRLYAYSGLPQAKTATLPVIAFCGLDTTIQSKLFVDINGEQVRVRKEHLVELYSTLHWNSPIGRNRLLALSSEIAARLSKDPSSPFIGHIKQINANKNSENNLTKTTISDELIKSKLIGSPSKGKRSNELLPGYLYKDDMETTAKFACDVISEYYNLFLESELVRQQWEEGRESYLRTNNGIKATLRLLPYLFGYIQYNECKGKEIRDLPVAKIKSLLQPYVQALIDFLEHASPEQLSAMRKDSSEGGVKNSAAMLEHQICNKFDRYVAKLNPTNKNFNLTDPKRQKATKDVSLIRDIIRNNVISSLKEKWGQETKEWWGSVAIPNKIKRSVGSQIAESGDEHPDFPSYLGLEELREIILANWDDFDEDYDIENPDAKKPEEKVEWLNHLILIKKKATTTMSGDIEDEDLTYLTHILEILQN